jgi:hypothetical protein
VRNIYVRGFVRCVEGSVSPRVQSHGRREHWQNLNGSWQFQLDPQNSGETHAHGRDTTVLCMRKALV